MEKPRITYALRLKGTEEIVRYSSRSNAGGYACYPVTYRLETGEDAQDLPVYEQPDLSKLKRALFQDTPDYNADFDTPMHGDVVIANLEIVERRIIEEHAPVAFEAPPAFRVVERIKKPLFMLRRYAGVATLSDTAVYLTFLEIPEGETAESVRRFEGQEVPLTGSYSYTTLLKVGPSLPEEYEDLLGEGNRFAAVTTF